MDIDRSNKSDSILEWFGFAIGCLKDNVLISLVTGLMFVGVINILLMGISSTIYVDMSLPVAGIIILVLGPIMVLNLYILASKYHQKVREYEKKTSISGESIKSVFFVSFVLLLLMMLYMMFMPAIYAMTTDSLTIGGFSSISSEIFSNKLMMFTLGVWSVFMGWIAFSISWFSFPMIVSNRISGIKAIIYSMKMSYEHLGLLFVWASIVVVLIGASLVTPYFLGLVVVIPVLAYATFDCNRILSKEVRSVAEGEGLTYNGKLSEYTHSTTKSE